MKRYVQFFRSAGNEMLGSDGIAMIDGRYNVARCIEIAKAQAKRIMDNLGGVITEYEIRAYKNDMFKHYIVIHRGVI